MADNKKEYFDIKGMRVGSARRIGDKGTIIFSLLGKGLGLYDLRIVNGANGAFVAAPQQKGKDGKYYAEYALYLSPEDEEKVIKAVVAKLPQPAGDTL